MRIRLLIFSVVIASAGCSSPIARPELPRSPENEQGRKLYIAKCARCHKLYEPVKYDDKTWDSWMTKMREKAKLNDAQYRQLSTYLQTLRTK